MATVLCVCITDYECYSEVYNNIAYIQHKLCCLKITWNGHTVSWLSVVPVDESSLIAPIYVWQRSQVNDKVLLRKRAKFHSWHSNWLQTNMTTQESFLCTNWLLGKDLAHSTNEGDGTVAAKSSTSSPLTECTRELYLGVERSKYTTLARKSTISSSQLTDQHEAMNTDWLLFCHPSLFVAFFCQV